MRQHLDVLRRGSADERQLSRVGLRLLRDFIIRRGIVDTNRALDHVLTPGFRKVQVRAPVFVVAPPRSGTTLLYALLAADPRFLAPRLYETLLPSVSLLRLTEWIGARVARRDGGEGFSRWEEQRFASSDPIHRVRHREIEEDTLLFDRLLTCPSSLRFFPRADELERLVVLDERPPAVRAAAMADYHRSVQRLLYRAPGRTWLAKNVHSAGRIGSLLERYPDARFIHIVRSPYDVIPSAVRLLSVSNYLGADEPQRPTLPLDHPAWRVHAELVIDGYQRLLRFERQVPASQWITLRFSALVGDPLGAVRGIYARFDLPLPADVEAAIAAEAARAPTFRSAAGAALTLEDVGLGRHEVHARLREVFEAYDLPP
jgi:omega-hydroxy-beta-dihydromenaquinone-9 sulfotransferase